LRVERVKFVLIPLITKSCILYGVSMISFISAFDLYFSTTQLTCKRRKCIIVRYVSEVITFKRKRLFTQTRKSALYMSLCVRNRPSVMCIITRGDLLLRVTRTFVSHIMENDLRRWECRAHLLGTWERCIIKLWNK